MKLLIAGCIAILCMANFSHAQQKTVNTATTSCTFQDGNQLSLRYNTDAADGKTVYPKEKCGRPAVHQCSFSPRRNSWLATRTSQPVPIACMSYRNAAIGLWC